MAKLGSTKLIFNVVNVENMFYVDVDCADIDFTGFTVKGIKSIYSTIINELSEAYEGAIYTMTNEIRDILKSLGITKSFNILNFASDYLFFEEIVIPKLSFSETTKAFELEMNKLYENYGNKYIFDSIKVPNNPQSNKFNIALIKNEKYTKVLQWFKNLKINLNYVTFDFNSLRRILIKNQVFSKKRRAIFIDIRKNTSHIIVFDSKRVIGSRITNNGIMDVVEALALKLNKEIPTIMADLIGGTIYEEELSTAEMNKLISKALDKTITEIKRIIGEYYVVEPLDNIILNLEYLYTPLIEISLRKILKVDFTSKKLLKYNVYDNLLSYGAMIKPNFLIDYKFPVKARISDEQKSKR